jgi:hypothetical protein
MHADETFEQFLEKTDASTHGAVRKVIEKAAIEKGWSKSSGVPLCNVDSRISFTMPIRMPETGGGGLNYMDFSSTSAVRLVNLLLCDLLCVACMLGLFPCVPTLLPLLCLYHDMLSCVFENQNQ